MTPQTTLIEYLRIAAAKHPAIRHPFGELTGMAEQTLYSKHPLEKQLISKAIALAEGLCRELEKLRIRVLRRGHLKDLGSKG